MSTKNTRNADSTLDRLKVVLNLKNDVALANSLGVKPTTISSWRSRDSLDHDRIIAKCIENKININWLHTGEGEIFVEKQAKLEPKILRMRDLDLNAFKNRFQHAVDSCAKGNIEHFSEETDIYIGDVKAYMEGERNPSDSDLNKISNRYKIKLKWLLYGETEPEFDSNEIYTDIESIRKLEPNTPLNKTLNQLIDIFKKGDYVMDWGRLSGMIDAVWQKLNEK